MRIKLIKFILLFLTYSIIYFFYPNILPFSFISIALCDDNNDNDSIVITTPSFKVPSLQLEIPKKVLREVKEVGQDVIVLAGMGKIFKATPPVARVGLTVGCYSLYKTCCFFSEVTSPHKEKSPKTPNLSVPSSSVDTKGQDGNSVANSPLEEKLSSLNLENLTNSSDDLQLAVICCIAVLLIAVFLFTFVLFSILSRPYIQKVKPLIQNYPILYRIFNFYSKWNETVSIPVRILFITLTYINLITCLYFLYIISKVFF